MKIGTYKIVNEDSDCGFSLINIIDFDPAKHKKFEEGKKPAAKKKGASKKSAKNA